MPLTATLSGTVVDINSNPVPNAVITVALWNYGNNTPTVSGGSIIVSPVVTVTSDGSGNFTTQVYGNDVISPLGTVYTVTYANANRITVSTATYTFNSNNTYNLNSFAPNVTYPIPVAMGPVNATQLQGRNISLLAPSDGQVLKWVAANSDWEPGTIVAGVTSVFGRSGAVTAQAGDYTWDQLGNAAGALTLANGANATTFNQTSNVAWLWANTTTATNVSTNASPTHQFSANYWTGAASAADTWTIGSSLVAGTNGTSTLSITHSGSTGGAQVSFPNGTATKPSITFAGDGTTGLVLNGSTHLGICSSGAQRVDISSVAVNLASAMVFGWGASSSNDAAFSRLGAASLALGNGTASDTTGTLTLTTLNIGSGAQGTPSLRWTGTSAGVGFCDIPATHKIIFGNAAQDWWAFNDNGPNIYFNATAVLGWTVGNNLNQSNPNDTGISRIGAASLAIGNGTAGDFTGSLKLTTVQMAASASAPTSAGTAGTAGQFIYNGGLLYFCSVTGAAGAATWNKLNMTAV